MNKCRLTMMFIALLLAVTSAKALTQDGDGNFLIGSVQDWIDFAEIIDKTNTGANARMTSDVDLGMIRLTLVTTRTNAIVVSLMEVVTD